MKVGGAQPAKLVGKLHQSMSLISKILIQQAQLEILDLFSRKLRDLDGLLVLKPGNLLGREGIGEEGEALWDVCRA